MFFNIALILLGFIVFIMLFYVVLPLRMTSSQLKIIWYLLMLCIAIIAFYVEPSSFDDLYRHYKEIEGIQNGSLHIWDSALIGRWFIFWLVSKTNSNGWLPFSTVILIGVLIGNILSDYMEKNKFTTRGILLYYFSALAGLGIFPIISGIRCALASTIWACAFYHWRDNKKKWYYIAILVCCSIHTIGIVFLCSDLIHIFISRKNSNKGLIIFRVVTIILFIRFLFDSNLVGGILDNMGGSYASLLSLKWDSYIDYDITSRTTGIGGMLLLGVFIIWIFCFLFCYVKKIECKYDSFFLFLIILSIAGTGIDIFYDRLPMAISVLSLPYCNSTVTALKKGNRVMFVFLSIGFFAVAIAYSTYSMCSHMLFNGNDYSEFWRQLFNL